MKCNVLKLRSARERRGMTQDKLAAEARVDIRTVQRAEAGASLRQETIADLAAVLGLPIANLIEQPVPMADRSEGLVPLLSPTFNLKRATTGREIIELLENTHLGKLECDADPTEEIMEILTEAIRFIEKMLPCVLSEEGIGGPLSFVSLVDRLQHIAKMNKILECLDQSGLALFIGSSWVNALMPRWSDEGPYIGRNQPPDLVRATRLLISASNADRANVLALTKWPVEVTELTPFDTDLDEDVPF
jgi:transcriptional regulator with XRE-family HTH domain